MQNQSAAPSEGLCLSLKAYNSRDTVPLISFYAVTNWVKIPLGQPHFL